MTPLSTADEAVEADDSTLSSHGYLVEPQSDTGGRGEENNATVLIQPTARRHLIDGLLTDHKST